MWLAANAAPPYLSGSTVNAAWQVDRYDGQVLNVDPLDRFDHLFRQITREARAKECIDDDVANLRHQRSKRIYRAIP